MANKKKTKKKPAKSKKKVSKKVVKVVKRATRAKRVVKKATRPKKVAKKKAAPKKAATKKKAAAKKPPRTPRGRADAFALNRPQPRDGGESGDLQGLSNVESADSESVDELLEEGNAFEADAVKGVEDAGDFDEREVHTHEVPEDDVPQQYLDED
jgi:hypothetical protein